MYIDRNVIHPRSIQYRRLNQLTPLNIRLGHHVNGFQVAPNGGTRRALVPKGASLYSLDLGNGSLMIYAHVGTTLYAVSVVSEASLEADVLFLAGSKH